jgi:hypothetical protein
MHDLKLLKLRSALLAFILVSITNQVYCRIHLRDTDLVEAIQNLTLNKLSNNFNFRPNELTETDDYSDNDNELYDVISHHDEFANTDYHDYGKKVTLEIKRQNDEGQKLTEGKQEDPLIQVCIMFIKVLSWLIGFLFKN